jgi:phosphate:Na+ symporter
VKRLLLLTAMAALSYLFFQSHNILNIAAGVAIFLFGMFSLEEGFRAYAGGFLEHLLKRVVDRPYKSLIFGIVTTSIMQSSSLVSVIAISFISAGLISLTQGIGIIFGANLGTTTGAWLIAGLGLKVDIALYAMPMLVFGTILMFQSDKKSKGLGNILAGLGFLFLGIAYMKEGFDAFKASIDLTQYSIGGFSGLLVYSLIGIAATVIMQSSHATLVLIITALSASQITYENALALAIGSNIGTTITAVLGSLTAGLEGKKLAAAHVIFNVATALIAIIFIHQFIFFVDLSARFIGISHEDYTLKLALFHSYFNAFGIALFSPFVLLLERLLNTLFKPKVGELLINDDVYFLNDTALDFPATTHTVLIKETKHLFNNVFEIIALGLSVTKEDITSGMEIDDIIKLRYRPIQVDMEQYYEHRIKEIYGKIIRFAIMAQGKFSEESIHDIIAIKNANIALVDAFKAAKHMQKNMLRYIESDNEDIRNEYNHIRRNLIKQLRTMQMIFNTAEDDVVVLLLSKIQLDVQKYDIAANKALDNLIRTNKITYSMATSLMNDTGYAYTIASELAKVAQALFVHEEKELKEEREALILSEAETTDLVSKERSRQ